MRCTRCQGMLKYDSYSSFEHWEGYVCALCGAVYDLQGQALRRDPRPDEMVRRVGSGIHGSPARDRLAGVPQETPS